MSLATSVLRASLAVAAGSASTGLGYAATVNLLCELDLNAVSSGACPSGACGTTNVTGDATSNLTTGTNGSAITFSGVGVSGTIGGKNYSYKRPASGRYDPDSDCFPEPYGDAPDCADNSSGKIRGGPFEDAASGADFTQSAFIGAPAGGGLFVQNVITFVADLFSNARPVR